MKKLYTFLLFLLSVPAFQIYAQAPVLPVKTDLATTLSGSKTFSDGANPDVLSFPLSSPSEFTLEVKTKINTAQGRGLDVEVKNAYGVGLRTSLDKTTFNNTTALPTLSNLSTSVDNAQEQTYRYVVKNGIASIYQDGHYLASKALEVVTDPSGAQPIVYGADNLLGRWAGVTGDNAGKPTTYGWANTYATLPWNTANSTSGVRYIDVTTGHTFESDNTAYVGRIMYIRWDGGASASTYSYPIKLEKGLQYEFSWLYEYVANAAAGAKMNVAINAAANGTGAIIASKSFTTGLANKLRKGDLSFTSEVEGTYYLTITANAAALFGIADLKLKASNLVNIWDGYVNNSGTGSPTAYGWFNTSLSPGFTAPNSASGVRYMDVTSGHTLESDGSNYSGRLLYLSWDSGNENALYSLPVQLEASKDYKFSWIYDYISNLTPGAKLHVSVNTSIDGTGTVIASKDFITGDANMLRKGDLSFTSPTAGTYYITITGDLALFGIGDLKVERQQVAKIIIGKNYAAGAVDMVVSSVTYEDAAYAPEKIVAPSSQALETAVDMSVGAIAKSNVVLKASSSLYLKNAYNPLINATVDLNTADARLYFENIKPSDVINSLPGSVTVNGATAVNGVNVSVSNYGSGTVVSPYLGVNYAPLEVYTEENFGGTSQQYVAVTPFADLGSFDNNIKSFKLKRGYMATFATNSDGSGYSRVYIATNQDLEVPVLSVYLKGTISFVRTMKWNEVSKKGLANGSNEVLAITNSTWFYNWNTGLDTTPSVEYVPIRQNNGWPSFTPAYTKEGYTHLLGFNEPDRPDQANMTVEEAIASWPALLKSGLRVGSPAGSDPFNGWTANFMAQAEAKNYRVDYMALHCYWYKSAAQWKSDLQSVFNAYHRPIWITEWNVGANWTGNSFPDGPVMLTDANATKHKNDLAGVLDVLETTDYVERYSLYNWVQDSRALYVTINDAFKTRNPNWESYVWLKTAPVISSTATEYVVLTPAGEYYAKNASAKAYNPAREYISTWKTLVETLSYKLSSDFQNATINWTGNNQELVNRYTVERRLEGEVDFSVFYDSINSTVLSVNDVVHSKAEYRLKVVGIDNTETVSPVITIIKAVVADTPSGLSGEAISTTIINLNWPAAARAEAYNLWRANTIDGSYALIASYLTATSFQDTGLTKNTPYYYAISALNTGGESPKSTPLTMTTLDLVVPAKVSNFGLASGDAKVKLQWAGMYDAEFYVKRSTSQSGPFTTIATAQTASYVDLTALNSTIYYYKIAAFNTAGEGAESDVIVSKPNLGQHAYYDFSDTTGLNAHDQWGYYDGTLAAAATWTTGKAGSGVDFNGTSTSYVKLKDGIMEGLNDFTITTWVNSKTISNNTRIFDFGYDTASWMAFIPYYGGDKIRYKISYGGNSAEVMGTYTLPVNQWVHLALVQSGDICKIYADGVEIASGTVALKPSGLGKTTANYLVKSQWPGDPFLNASMDEFSIFNRAFNAAEINGLMNATSLDVDDFSNTTAPFDVVRAFPNPTSGQFDVILPTNEDSVSIAIYTVGGKLISKSGYRVENGKVHLNITNEPTGVYLIKIQSYPDKTIRIIKK